MKRLGSEILRQSAPGDLGKTLIRLAKLAEAAHQYEVAAALAHDRAQREEAPAMDAIREAAR